VFLLATLLCLKLIEPSGSDRLSLRTVVKVCGGCFLAGVLIELLVRGYASGMGAKFLLGLLVAGLLLISLVRPLLTTQIFWQRNHDFPVLMDFESRAFMMQASNDATMNVVSAPKNWQSNDTRAGKASLLGGRYPGIRLRHPYPDWTGYQQLLLEIFSLQEDNATLTLRIDDYQHNNALNDRFNRQLIVRPGLNYFRIKLAEIRSAPATRAMDLAQISRLMLFAVEPRLPITLYIDNIRLE